MDLAELRRNLELLESRYCELVEKGDSRVKALEVDLAERSQQSEEQNLRIRSLEAELGETARKRRKLQLELEQLCVQLSVRSQDQDELAARAQELVATESRWMAERDDLIQQQQTLEARVTELQVGCDRLAEQLACQVELLQHKEERLQAVPLLQHELQESRKHAAKLRQDLRAMEAAERDFRAWVESECSALRVERSRFQDEVDAHAASLRELEVLRKECARRFPALQLSEERAATIRRLERHCSELERQHQARQDACKKAEAQAVLIRGLEEQLALARKALCEQQAQPLPLEPSERFQQMEQELKEARDEVELLQEQLFLVQEELEHYYLLSQEQGQLSHALGVRPTSRQDDASAINSNRGRLLSVV